MDHRQTKDRWDKAPKKGKGAEEAPSSSDQTCSELPAAIDGFLQICACSKFRNFLCGYLQGLASLRIPAGPCLARADRERAESNQRDLASALQRPCDSFDSGVQSTPSLDFRNSGILRDLVNQLALVHIDILSFVGLIYF